MAKKTILLACSAGMSTSMLVAKMQDAAKAKGYDVHIEANPTNLTMNKVAEADALLLGPQVRYELAQWKKVVNGKIPVDVIDMLDYGQMNGEKVLENIWKKIK